jgi:hypothetical protein
MRFQLPLMPVAQALSSPVGSQDQATTTQPQYLLMIALTKDLGYSEDSPSALSLSPSP